MSERELRFGLAGLGQHGERYATHLLAGDVPHARLTMVHRSDRTRGLAFAAEHRVAWASSLEELVAHRDVDAVLGVLPPSLHPRLVELAAAAGKPILVEKPLAPTAAEAQRAVGAAEAAGIPAMVAQTMRFDSTVRALRNALPEVGRIHLVTVSHRFEPSGRAWLDDPEEGGLVSNTGIHGVDLLRHLTGAEIVHAWGTASHLVTQHAPDLFAGVLRLEPGPILGTIDNSRGTDSRTGRIEVVGDKGQLLADHVAATLEFVAGRTRTTRSIGPPVPTVREALRSFSGAVLAGSPVPIPLREGLASVAAVDRLSKAFTEEAS